MDATRINTNLTTNEKIRQLNEMIMTLEGKIEQAKFDKNELDQMFTDAAYDRKFLRGVELGHTTGSYTDWTHVKEETGYSIWKIAPANYTHNALNKLYLDDAVLENRGTATAETATAFDKVFLYDDSATAYVDNSTEAGTETGTEFLLLEETTDYIYVGNAAQYSAIKMEFYTRGAGTTLVVEYWNGSAWTVMTANANNLSDSTDGFESDGLISYTAPGDWATTTVNAVASKYWIRLSTSSAPITVAEAYYIVPGTSAIGLLALSSEEITAGEWAWCYYNSSIYVTLRNAGSSTYEGDYFITSASSSTNKENFFVYNHEITLDHEDSSYVAKNPSFGILSFNSAAGATVAGSGTTYATVGASDIGTTAFSTTEANRQSIIPVACQVKNFYVRTTGAQPSGSTGLTFTVRKNGVDTAITANIPASGAAQTASYTGAAVAFAAGDLISIKIVNASGSTSATIRQIALELNKT